MLMVCACLLFPLSISLSLSLTVCVFICVACLLTHVVLAGVTVACMVNPHSVLIEEDTCQNRTDARMGHDDL